MIESQARTGIDVLMLYGHSEHGCESANSDISPGDQPRWQGRLPPDVRRAARTGDAGPDHDPPPIGDRHRRPRVPPLRRAGRSRTAKGCPGARSGTRRRSSPSGWRCSATTRGPGRSGTASAPTATSGGKDAAINCCDLIELGLDGVQLDTLGVEGTLCFATDHGHKPGEGQTAKLAERLAWLRRRSWASSPTS